MEVIKTVSELEKAGLIGVLLALALALGYGGLLMVQYTLKRHVETVAALRGEIGRREAMLEGNQKELVRLVELVTATVARNTEVMQAMVRVAENCPRGKS